MRDAAAIRRFLLTRQGYYCDACLASAAGLSLEKEVIGIRTIA